VHEAALLLRPLIRSMTWGPLAGSAVVGLVIAYIRTRDPCALSGAPCVFLGTRIQALRISAVLLAMGAAFVLDDPAQVTTLAAPTPLLLRRALRVAIVVPALAVAWGATVWVIRRSEIPTESLPIAAVTLELAALVAVALAAAVVMSELVPERLGGLASGPVLLALVAGALFLPSRFALFVSEPGLPRWHGAHQLWLGILGVGVLVMLFGYSDRTRSFGRIRRSAG
jgi:hypothetical protein